MAGNSTPCWQLTPTSPCKNLTYTRSRDKVNISHTTISAASFASSDTSTPSYLTQHWSEHIHPEGTPYFVRDQCQDSLQDSFPRVVTTDQMSNNETMKHMEEAVTQIRLKMAQTAEMGQIPGSSSSQLEIFLRLDNDAESTCQYYLVDHSKQVVFWLEEVSSKELDLHETVSARHLKQVLHEQYWEHVEAFPAPHDNLVHASLDDLKTVFAQAKIDHLTSASSTFIHDMDECENVLDTLVTLSSSPPCQYSMWTIARLWGNVARHRVMTHYGEQHARTNSTMSIVNFHVPKEGILFNLCDRLAFGVAGSYLRELNKQWVDRSVNLSSFRKFAESCQADWTASLIVTFATLIANFFLLSSPIDFPRTIIYITMVTCIVGIFTGTVLFLHLRLPHVRRASDVDKFLRGCFNIRFIGFQHIAIAFSLPRVCALWAVLLSALHPLVIAVGWLITYSCAAGIFLILAFYPELSRLSSKAWCFVENQCSRSIVPSCVVIHALSYFRRKRAESSDELTEKCEVSKSEA